MKGKTNIGKVLISVVIAVTMVIPVVPAAVQGNSNNGSRNSVFMTEFTPTSEEPEHVAPDADVLFYEDFSTGLGAFTVANLSGWGNYSWNSGEWVDWIATTNPYYQDEDDYLNASVNLGSVDPTCVDTVILQFEYWGDGGQFRVETDGTVWGTYTAATAHQIADIIITSLAGTTFTLSFHVTGTQDRNFSIDNVTISANYTTDIVINGIENMTNGGRYNTFPKVIEVNVTNRGTQPITDVDFHLQIYKEQPYEPEDYICWNMESCFLNTWVTLSADGDQATWTWTEKRSHSPTHSFHSQPDYLETYEAYSEDYLYLREWFNIPTTVDSKVVHAAFLNFSHWCQGEYGEEAYDYGMVYIEYQTNPGVLVPIGGPYYDTDEAWEYEEIQLPATAIGANIKVWFGWFSDGYMNFEGWYIDDVCIKFAYTSAQPLVFQGYKYEDFEAGETKLVRFPVEFDPDEGTYYIQVYTDCDDCILGNNEINWTIWFGDVCDGAVIDIIAPSEIEFQWDTGLAENYVHVPINVTVYNNGTLAEEIPIKVSARHLIKEKIFSDDVESGDQGYDHDAFYGDDLWGITDFDFYSPYHAWAFMDDTHHYGSGIGGAFWRPPDVVDWGAVWHDKNFDIKYKIKWNLVDSLGMWAHCGNYVITLSSSFHYLRGYPNQQPWTEVSTKDWLHNYLVGHNVETLGELGEDLINWLNGVAGTSYVYPDDFHGYGWIIWGAGGYGTLTTGLTTGPWSGVLIDDVYIGTVREGDEVWSDTNTTKLLEPGESQVLNFTWNTTEFCDYIIKAEVTLDCDMDPNNNEISTTTRIYMQIYNNSYEKNQTEDNTYGLPDDWHIVEECSFCPNDHFWWNGIIEDDVAAYQANADDVLEMYPDPKNESQLFNFTALGWYNLTFDAWWSLELYYDYCLLEVSNDSGLNWYPVYEFTGDSDWTTISLVLYDPFGTGILQNWNALPDLWYPWPVPPIGPTDEMMFRFHMISDSAVQYKGIYIDDVNLTYDNGTKVTVLFYDDMESGEGKWIHMKDYAGDLWHQEADYWECADTYYSWYNVYSAPDPIWGYQWFWYDEAFDNYYRNNMDDKLILYFDLRHAYEAYFSWEQNYTFNGMYPDDYGVVEIWTGSDWKALFIVQGDSGGAWGSMRLDISDYVGGDELTMIRFRFISNETGIGIGWKVRNFSIDGKVDYIAPTITATLDPATPDGNYGWYKSPVTVTITAEDNVKVAAIYYRIDGGPWKLYTAPITIDVDGEHTVDYYAVDEVGNPSATGSVSFKIDSTAPTASITAPESGYIYLFGRQLFKNPLGGTVIIGGINFQASASDATSGVDYVTFEIDGYTYEKATTPYEIWWHKFDLLPAKYTLTVSAYDVAGNKAADATLDFTHWL